MKLDPKAKDACLMRWFNTTQDFVCEESTMQREGFGEVAVVRFAN